jgi:transposase
VFIDETAVSTNLARLRGRAPRGVRVIGTVPLGTWETITFVAALRHDKMTAPMVIEGAMTGEMFLAYVEQCLVPTLRRNDIVVMDNCRVHMAPAIREAIEKARRHCATCRNTLLTSIRSRCLTVNSRRFSARWQRRSGPHASNSLVHPTTRPSRMCQLFQPCRLCFNMTGIRFSLLLYELAARRSNEQILPRRFHVERSRHQAVSPGRLANS